MPDCKVCDGGRLSAKKTHRLSGPAVVIGYIFLIPSFFGMLMGIFIFFGSGATAVEVSNKSDKVVEKKLKSAKIPTVIINKVIDHKPVTVEEKKKLTPKQRELLANVRLEHSASKVGAGIGGALGTGFGLFLIFASFVGGLLGWILTMKKKILQCNSCQAVVNAS